MHITLVNHHVGGKAGGGGGVRLMLELGTGLVERGNTALTWHPLVLLAQQLEGSPS